MPLILPGNVASAIGGGYDVDNSCRFNGSDSYMHWTDTGGSGSRVQFSISLWCKKCSNGAFNPLVLAYQDGDNFTNLQFNSSDQLQWYNETGNQIKGNLITNRFFRDPSAWYHILAVFDSGNGTAGNRMRLYVNGTEETSFATDANPDQNESSWFNYQDKKVHLGYDTGDLGWAGSALAFNGYIAQFMLVDGTVLTPSDVGEFDSDSPTIWKPIDISSTSVGTNGAFLDFADSDNLGDNEGIAGEDWTEVNLDATDSATDTPTNNFCTMNPLYKMDDPTTFSEGNCKAVVAGSSWAAQKGTIAVNTGKWYWEIKLSAGTIANYFLGVQGINVDEDAGSPQEVSPTVVWYNGDASIGVDGSYSGSHGALDQGDIMGIALDMDAGSYGQITIYDQNAASVSNVDLSSAADYVMPFGANVTSTSEFNFGGCSAFTISSAAADENNYGNFEFEPPSGYLALCTKNLATDG